MEELDSEDADVPIAPSSREELLPEELRSVAIEAFELKMDA